MRFLLLILFILFLVSGEGFIRGQSGELRISEFMAINESTLTDKEGDYSDWIEIFNPSSASVYLRGWSLTDDLREPGKWKFPSCFIKSGEYFLVFASGKNRVIDGNEIHTNFKLSGSGEVLALIKPDGTISSIFSGGYPAQKPDVSYGFLLSNEIPGFLNPSPGSANRYIWGPEISAPQLSHKHGFYENSFLLKITGQDTEADLYYTLDGSLPDVNGGIKYTAPIRISSTTILRVGAIIQNLKPSKTVTRTFLFPDDVIHQSASPSGYPATWGPYTGITGIAIADYEMDPEMISDPLVAQSVKKALKSLPVISLVTDRNYFFSNENDPEHGGIYIFTGPPLTNTTNGTGFGWERPVSFEYFDADDSVSLQVDCGIELHGGHSRRAEKSPKHSFRLVFRKKYGPSKLNYPIFGNDAVNEFDAIVLRAGFNNSWVHHSSPERVQAQYISDTWAKDTHREMGHYASKSFFAHLFINGLYWGIYNPSEKPDEDLLSSYFGGESEDYDIIKDYAEIANGTPDEWNKLVQMANAGLSSNVSYQRIQGKNSTGDYDPELSPMIDVVSLADYMILNLYAGNTDWDHHNWIAVRNRINPGKGFQFFIWDAEKILEDPQINILGENNDNRPSRIFQQMMKNQEYKRLFADRIQKFCFENGPLTASSSVGLWSELSAKISNSIIAESARWGDYRRDVHKYQSAGPFDLYTVSGHWIPRNTFMMNVYFPSRTDIFISQLQEKGWFPSLSAPRYYINGESVMNSTINRNDTLTLESDSGIIYYTTDGSDPVIWQPEAKINPAALKYKENLILSKSTIIRSRVYSDGTWSAMNERQFIVPEEYRNLKITEIQYFPRPKGGADDKDIEFLELKNTGTNALPLENVHFTEGIRYRFSEGSEIEPDEIITLSSNPATFSEEYGFAPYGLYSGHLENNGERVTIVDPEGAIITTVNYSASEAWPLETQGGGKSLVPLSINPAGNQDSSAYWRSSFLFGGSPGKDDIFNPELQQELKHNDLAVLLPPYPNPAKEYVYFPYSLLNDSYIELSIYTMTGIKVEVVYEGNRPAGDYVDIWTPVSLSGTDNYGAGMFIYRLIVISGGYSGELNGKIIFTK